MCKFDTDLTIKKVTFEKRGYITVYLSDKRIILVPLSLYPNIKKLSSDKRKIYGIIEGQYVRFNHAAIKYIELKEILSLYPV